MAVLALQGGGPLVGRRRCACRRRSAGARRSLAAQSSRMGAAASSKRWRSASSRASFSAMNCGPGGSAGGGARSAMGVDASSLAAYYPNPQV